MTISDPERGAKDRPVHLASFRLSAAPPAGDGREHDLAASRREAAALRRENDRLRAQLRIVAQPRRGSIASAPAATGLAIAELAPAAPPLWCGRCGLLIESPAGSHDSVLVRAACCPTCDGPLTAAHVALDPSTYLG